MRVLITGITEPGGPAPARMLLAAGHRVIGLDRRWHRHVDPRVEFVAGDPTDRAVCTRAAAGCDAVLHLAGPDVSAIGVAAREAGARLIVPVVAGARWSGIAESAVAQAVRSCGADVLLIRTAPVVGRRVGHQTRRALEPILGAGSPTAEFQLLHADDLDRFLVVAVTAPRVGEVELAAPGVITKGQLRILLRGAGVRYSAWVPGWSGTRPVLDPAAAREEWGFRCGWNAGEAAADLVRGLVGRAPAGGAFRTRRGAIPLPAHVIPARAATSDGHHLVDVAPERLEGEFDDRVDPRYPVHTATNTSEALPGPMTPLTIDLHAGAIRLANEAMGTMIALDGIALEHWTSRVTTVLGHHIYINASIGVLAAENMPGWDEESIRRDAYGNIPAEIALQPHGKPPMPTGLAGTAATWRATARVLATARRYAATAEAINAAARAEALPPERIAALTDEQLHVRALLWRDRLHQAWQAASIGVMMTGAATAVHARGKDAGEVPIDLSRLESAKPMLAVERLAALCRADSALYDRAREGDVDSARAASPAFAAALDAELATVGHRGPGECELSNPTFGDRPALLVTAAARAAQLPAPQRPPAEPATSRTARMAAGATVARERARDAVVRITHCLRGAVRERGERLVRATVLPDATDVHYLTLDEIFVPPADVAERARRRRAERERLRAIRMPDVITGRWEPVPAAGALDAGESLGGIGVSAGVVEGTVKLVLSLDDDIEPGDVLVASVTDTGHTAMFAYAAAVVTDIGGSASHAAIVAREFGIPCVVDTKTASARLRDGQKVRVDGAAGTVTLLSD
ncbi:NAD-dependent epimerase/dehydratase family protein [Nocardia puris]|uniref:PEP-utilizing enzyme n=1 Tax=Nocardia puris TaxID=208602 RepID=UPI001894561D|nr:PEP-utilizing enzyme [Nocardia puris]MBF6210311.1 NAD-dependent epimerase/dehydratase family protein [Nocardia puris]MBF6367386.1 NAD-dependent epimerase/dehydratase family protein [Nocardia puris]MBF6457571.1 NAD-dependent epimerase/dehydratase family protein [Nocardia puris]